MLQLENDFDRRRQLSSLGHPGFSEHQTRFGLNSPLQNFQSQSNILGSPTPNTPIFQQSLFQNQQSQSNQQPYVPQFNSHTLLPNQNILNNGLQNNLPLPSNSLPAFQFSQQNLANPGLLNNFQQSNPQLPHQQPIPTLPTFGNPQNNFQYNRPPSFPNTVNIGNQRPTQPAFLPTVPTQNSVNFNQPNPISIHPAPNLNPHNANEAQIPFQPAAGQTPIFTNGQSSQIQSLFEQQSKENLEKIKELQDRQRIIQKHQEFVQKQQQKQQEKVEKLHEDFLNKQSKKNLPIFSTTEAYEDYYNSQEKRRPIMPHETDLFKKAVEMYEKLHPTTTTTTTTTTTQAPTTRFKPRAKLTSRTPPQDRNKQKLYHEIKTLLEESETKGFDDNLRAKSVALLQKPDILKQLKVALAENPDDFNEKNYSSREISLNGQKFEVIRTTNPNLIPKGAISADGSSLSQIVTASPPTTQKESRISFDDLTKGVLPPGADFELIKQSENGKLEEVSKIPATIQNKKKVTFVFLEEQDDGSYKVKGVKANGQQTEEGPEVENILNKIKKGEIQLPGNTKITNTISASTQAPSTEADYAAASSIHPSSYSSIITTSNHGSTGHTNPIFHQSTTPAPSSAYRSSSNGNTQTTRTSRPQTPFISSSSRGVTTTERYVPKSTQSNTFTQTRSAHSPRVINTTPSYRPTVEDLVVIGSSTPSPNLDFDTRSHSQYARDVKPGMVDILKENGLFATAKYLKQSGLDTILNETGPYTIFAPTDKAFRTLLVQLGGPDKAEEKFRDNPRLLSGVSTFIPTFLLINQFPTYFYGLKEAGLPIEKAN